MVRNLSDFSFCYGLSVAYLCEKSDWNYSVFGRGFRLGLLLHAGLSGKHSFLCIPHLLHQLFYFLYIGFIHIACGIHALCYLVQITADFSQHVVVIPQVWIVNVIDKAIQNQAAEESGFAFHAGGFYLLLQYVLLIVTQMILHNLQSCRGGCSCKKWVKKSEIPAGHFVVSERRGG